MLLVPLPELRGLAELEEHQPQQRVEADPHAVDAVLRLGAFRDLEVVSNAGRDHAVHAGVRSGATAAVSGAGRHAGRGTGLARVHPSHDIVYRRRGFAKALAAGPGTGLARVHLRGAVVIVVVVVVLDGPEHFMIVSAEDPHEVRRAAADAECDGALGFQTVDDGYGTRHVDHGSGVLVLAGERDLLERHLHAQLVKLVVLVAGRQGADEVVHRHAGRHALRLSHALAVDHHAARRILDGALHHARQLGCMIGMGLYLVLNRAAGCTNRRTLAARGRGADPPQ